VKVAIVQAHFNIVNVPNELPLAKGLTELGVEVEVFTSDSIGKRAKFIPKEFIEKGISEEKKFGFKINRLNSLFDWRGENPFILSLEKELIKKEYDLIQSTDYYRFITLDSIKAAKKTNKPFIFTSHRYIEPTHFISKQMLNFSIPYFQKKVLNNTKHIIAVSNQTKNYILNRFKYQQDNISIITQGIDHEIFKEKNKPGQNKLLTIGRLIPLKGQKYLIRACNILKKDGVEFSLTIKGSGPENKNIKDLIKKYDLEKNVIIEEEFTWHFDMPKIFNSYDIFVFPSLIEPIGLSILEAMSCSMPVIGTKVGGLIEAIKDGENGFLVQPANENELAEKVKQLLEDKKLRKNLGRNARDTIINKFSYKKMAKQHLELYRSLIN